MFNMLKKFISCSVVTLFVLSALPVIALADSSKTITIDSCTYAITDYDRWEDYLSLAKFLETGNPEMNRLQPLCRQMPNSSFTVHSDGDNDPAKSFNVSVNGCTFNVTVKTEGNSVVVYGPGMNKCKTPQEINWSIVNSERSGADINHHVRCASGRIIIALENRQLKKFFVGAAMYGNLHEAVSKNCN